MKGLGERIRELREEKELSQMKLSKAVGITQAAIARYELNLTEPKASDIKKLCDFFGVTSDYLIGLDEIFTNKNTIVYHNSTHNGNNKF